MLSDSDITESSGRVKGRRRSRTIGTPRATGRVSPVGAEREREFPTTKVGGSNQQGVDSMGAENDRQYGTYHPHNNHSGRCGGSHTLVPGSASHQPLTRPVITGDLVQSRDFHYTVEPVYRRPREVAAGTYGHRGGEPDYSYLEHKASPYHSGTLRTSVRGLAEDGSRVSREDRHSRSDDRSRVADDRSTRGSDDRSRLSDERSRVVSDERARLDEALRTGRLDQNYMMVRAQSRLQDNSRLQGLQETSRLQGLQESSRLQNLQETSSRLQNLQDTARLQLQENSRLHASLQDGYDRISHRSESRNDILDCEGPPVYDLYYHPTHYSGFVRTCDGKFVRTSIPGHELDSLESPQYRSSSNTSSAMHTMRRTSKNRHQNHSSDYCCPARDDLSGGMRPSDQLQQSYATLRGRKWSDKNCKGVGDNYGRINNFADDARSVHSLADDFLLPPPVAAGGGRSHHKTISRSTDKSLDSLGLEDKSDQHVGGGGGSGGGLLKRDQSDHVVGLLKREPPDGKEKPEPPKQQKFETLSRKNSKSDLIERGAAAAVDQVDSGHIKLEKRDSVTGLKEGGGGHTPYLGAHPGLGTHLAVHQASLDPGSLKDEDLVTDRHKDWKMPSSPRCTVPSGPGAQISASIACSSSPKPLGPPGLGTSLGASTLNPHAAAGLNPHTAAGLNPHTAGLNTPASRPRQPSLTSQMAARALNTSGYSEPCTSLSPLCQDPHPSTPAQLKTYFTRKILRFFGVDPGWEEQSRQLWTERRRRLAIKKLGGVKEEEYLSGFGVENSGYSGYSHPVPPTLTSELEGDKMVLKIAKPPRDKDSVLSLSWQCCAWMVSSMKRVPDLHTLKSQHLLSRSYLPSAAGQAAFYQAETCGGLAVCQPLTRISNHHHQGESPAEEVFFSAPSHQLPEPAPSSHQRPNNLDPYRTCSWQLPRVESELPRMSSDVGVSRIWNRMLDAAFDNSNRRKHGMGLVGKVVRKRRLMRHVPEPARKRKLGGNARDHRPFFTYWVSFVQISVLFISLLLYGFGPVGVDLYKRSSMVLVTSLSLESVGYLEPANFWIGPSALDLIHLGAKYGPCMRWDEKIDRQIRNERIKERDTACCLREDQAGCVQTQKSECKSATGDTGVAAIPAVANHKWRLAVGAAAGWNYADDHHLAPHDKWSQYPDHHRSSGPVCGLDPAFCEAPASIAPYIWPDDITKWPICRKRKEHADTPPSEAEHMVCEVIGHPCCIGIRGECQITTREFCDFVKGNFHEEAALCSQVSCMDDVCGLIPFRQRDVPDQFYRTWTSLFLHAGIFHLVMTLAFQYWLVRDLEKLIGAGRLALIYLGSGMVGNLASAIFVPNRAEVGPCGAHFGVLAASIVEVIHQWPSLKYPEMAVLKLVGVTAVFFLSGLLPWIDNYAHLFGFIFGFLVSYAILPFVTFGLYDRRRKVVLLWLCLVFALLIFVGLVLLFYVSPIQDCEVCKYFNCIPITKDFCSEQNINLKTDTG